MERETTRYILGCLLAFLVALLYTVSAGFVQGLRNTVPDFQLQVPRFLIQTCLGLMAVAYMRNINPIQRTKWGYYILSSVALVAVMVFMVYSLTYLPAGNVYAILIAVSLIARVVLTCLCLTESVTPLQLIAVTLSASGIITVWQPWNRVNLKTRRQNITEIVALDEHKDGMSMSNSVFHFIP